MIVFVAMEVSGLTLYWAIFKGNWDAQEYYWDKLFLFVSVCLLSAEIMLVKHIWGKILYFMIHSIKNQSISELAVIREKTLVPVVTVN